MKLIVLTALAMIASVAGYAQNSPGEIEGKVINAEDNLGFIGAHVSVVENGSKVIRSTDIDGKFSIKPLTPGTYDVTITAVGMDTIIIQGIKVQPERITRLEQQTLNNYVATLLGAEVIHWVEPLIRIDNPSLKSISLEDMQERADLRDVGELLANSIPDIKKKEGSDELYFRGSRNGAVIYYIDGVKVRNAITGVPARAISSMNIYTGGVPAKYGDTTGGVVAIETLTYSEMLKLRRRGVL